MTNSTRSPVEPRFLLLDLLLFHLLRLLLLRRRRRRIVFRPRPHPRRHPPPLQLLVPPPPPPAHPPGLLRAKARVLLLAEPDGSQPESASRLLASAADRLSALPDHPDAAVARYNALAFAALPGGGGGGGGGGCPAGFATAAVALGAVEDAVQWNMTATGHQGVQLRCVVQGDINSDTPAVTAPLTGFPYLRFGPRRQLAELQTAVSQSVDSRPGGGSVTAGKEPRAHVSTRQHRSHGSRHRAEHALRERDAQFAQFELPCTEDCFYLLEFGLDLTYRLGPAHGVRSGICSALKR